MAQSLSQKAVNNFVKGLITEAAELTFPDGASVDELNCDLRRDGTRRRRLGVEYETGNVLSTYTLGDSEQTATGSWVNVGGNADLEFLVFQKGARLYFYNKGALPYSNQVESNSVNLASYEQSGSNGADTAKCQFTSIKGNLVVSSPEINTIAIQYSSGTFTVTQISFEIRDFEYQGNTSEYYEEKSSPSQDRKYDTQNAGWVGTKGAAALSTWSSANSSKHPPLTHPWYAGKDSNGDFDAAEWDRIYGGTTLTGNGHYILDFFTKNRGSASGLTGLTKMTDSESSRFRCAESFSGRVFYAGIDSAENAGTILFSKVVETVDDLGICHQQNDPTAEYLSDLYATDGGEIRIPDAVKIQRLYAYQNSLFVFAENGVWQISGVDGVFRATEFSVNRVTRVGILQPQTFVEAEGVPYWWSRFGIHTLTTDPVSGQGTEQNLTIPTVQTFWDNIDADAKLKVTAVYDAINKRIYWGYPDANETVESKINNFLILDVPLQAFIPWKISDQTSNTDCVVGLAFYSGYGASEVALDVTSNNGVDDVVTSAGDDVVSTQVSNTTTGDAAIILICREGSNNKITFGAFTAIDFLDWGDTNYSSFAETGYDFIGDVITKKNAPYIVTYCRVTETGFTGNETAGYEPIRPSGLKVSAAWDFAEDFGTSQQVYRLKYPVLPDNSNLSDFNYPDDVITSRVKIRGHGRSMRLKYESEQGKDFLLLGWGLVQGRNPRY